MENLVEIWNVHGDMIKELAAGGIGVSVALQLFKRWLENQKQGVILFLNGLLSFASALAIYVINDAAQGGAVVGKNTAAIVGVATVAYQFPGVGIKSLTGVLRDAKEKRLERTAQTDVSMPATTPINTLNEL